MAAVLAVGPDAVLSHRSAAALWSVHASRYLEVTDGRSHRRLPGLAVHRSSLAPDEITTERGIPLTTVPRTLLDLATVLRRSQVERAVNEAEVRGLTDRLSLPALIDRHPGRPGTPMIKAILSRRTNVTHSELEARFLSFIAESGLPAPEVNAWLQVRGDWIECDCVWRPQRLVVELDGRAVHGTALAFERDRARDRRLHAEGWRIVRITWHQLQDEAHLLAADLRTVLNRPSL